MARPIKKGLDYFSFDVDFFEDDKIQLIESECGIKAAYVAIRLLCLIYKNGYYYQWGNDECMLFSRRIGGEITINDIDEIIQCLVKRGMFNEHLYRTYGVLSSAGIQRRYLEAKKKTVDYLDENYNLLSNQKQFFGVFEEKTIVNSEKTIVNSEKTIVNSEFSTQRKEKKSKENKEEENKEEVSHSSQSSLETYIKDHYTGQSKERKVALKERKDDEPSHIPPYVRKAYNRETEEQYTDSLLNDEKFLADTAITTNVPLQKIKEYVPIFIAHCRATEASHRSSGDFKSHFINYINKREHNGKETRTNFSSDAERRRGTDNIKDYTADQYSGSSI